MPRPYPPEFRARAIALVRAGKQAKQTAVELGIHPVTLSKWLRQDDVDNGRRPGTPSSPSGRCRTGRQAREAPGGASTQRLLSKQLVTQFEHVALEDLRVKNMTRTARGNVEKPGRNVAAKAGLNRAILDVGFGEIRRQIEY